MKIKLFTLPNLMTLGNLLCGCLGIVAVFEGKYIFASFYIMIALIFDFLDGFVARLTKTSSPIGKELDSLADMVTFGVLPALIIFYLIDDALVTKCPNEIDGRFYQYTAESNLAFLLTLFSALRLAKFNIDTRQSDSFIGVPTPANAIIVASFPLILKYNPAYTSYILNPTFLLAYTLIMSYLLIAEIPLFALKFKNFSWADNKIKFIFLILSVILLAVLQFVAVPLIIIFYILLSVANNFLTKK